MAAVGSSPARSSSSPTPVSRSGEPRPGRPDHLAVVESAAARGAPVQGCCAWSLMDDFGWAYGYWPRFGLARVDYDTRARTVKRSGRTCARLIAEHTGRA